MFFIGNYTFNVMEILSKRCLRRIQKRITYIIKIDLSNFSWNSLYVILIYNFYIFITWKFSLNLIWPKFIIDCSFYSNYIWIIYSILLIKIKGCWKNRRRMEWMLCIKKFIWSISIERFKIRITRFF